MLDTVGQWQQNVCLSKPDWGIVCTFASPKCHNLQVGALLLGGSALFRTNGLTQFGARHIDSRVGGDPFSNTGEAEESVQLPIALWWVLA